MMIQRPNCMKTLRQGSVSISLSPAARSCAGPRPASGVSGYQEPAGGNEEGAVANHRATGFSGHCAADQMGLAVEAQARICGFAADRECPISVAEQSVLAGADELRGQHIVIVGAERCGAGPPRLGPLPSGRPSPPPMPPAGRLGRAAVAQG